MSDSADGRGRRLRNISEIRTFFRTNETPILFVGPTAFNLLGLDRWVRNFSYVAYYDSWEGAHPRVFVPKSKQYVEFKSAEEINNYLLRLPEVQDFIARKGGSPKVAMVFFDKETEQICSDLGYDLILPSHELRQRLDSKITTTKLGNEAGAPSVPNVLGTADSYDQLVRLAASRDLGTDLVIQTPYGDSGKTTFFVKSRTEWDAHAEDIVGEDLKVMKRINNKAAAVEAVHHRARHDRRPVHDRPHRLSRAHAVPGRLVRQRPVPGCALRRPSVARDRTACAASATGFATEGYKGFFEVDVLIDLDTDEVYLGELNPRISGASSITNVTAGAYADLPLFLFHVLEYMDVDYDVDVDEINERWRELAAVDVWSQLVMKEPQAQVEQILAAPRTGQWQLHEDGTLSFHRAALDWHQLQDETECFFLRVYGPGDYRFKGADLGILVTKGRLQTDEPKELTERARRFIEGVRSHYAGTPAGAEIHPPPMSYLTSSAF